MERILNDVINDLRACGYDCDAFLNDRSILAQNSEQAGVVFYFNALTWTQDKYGRESLPLIFWVGFPTLANNTQLEIDLFEHVKAVGNKFIYLLKTYEDSEGMQLIEIESSSWEQFFDFAPFEIATSGYYITLNIAKNNTTQC